MPSVAIIGTRGYPSYYGGFETAVRKLAPYLAERDWDVTVYGRPGATTPGDPALDARVRTVETWGVESKSLSTLSYGLTASVHAGLRRPDVVLVMNIANGYFLPILNMRGIPSLVNVDGIEWDREKWGGLAKFVFKTGARATAKWGTQLVVDAQEIGRRWREDFNRTGTFIPYGGDRVVGELPVEPGLVRRAYALVVARFVPENTIPEFFDAVERLAEHHQVAIVGSSGYGGDLDKRATELAERYDNVRAYGHVHDDRKLLSLWQHAGVYFHGHSVGGTNPALVQAMAAGAPIVARDTAYTREVLQEHARFVGPDPAEIARELSAVLSDPSEQERLSSGARARAEDSYAWERVCADYEHALRSLVLGRAAGATSTPRRSGVL